MLTHVGTRAARVQAGRRPEPAAFGRDRARLRSPSDAQAVHREGSARREDGDVARGAELSRPRARAQPAPHRCASPWVATRTGRRSRRTATSSFVPLNHENRTARRCRRPATRSRSRSRSTTRFASSKSPDDFGQSDEGEAARPFVDALAFSRVDANTCNAIASAKRAEHDRRAPASNALSKCSPSNARRRVTPGPCARADRRFVDPDGCQRRVRVHLPPMAEMHDTTEEYLESILAIEEEGVVPMRARLVERLGLSAAAVSETVGRLVRPRLRRAARRPQPAPHRQGPRGSPPRSCAGTGSPSACSSTSSGSSGRRCTAKPTAGSTRSRPTSRRSSCCCSATRDVPARQPDPRFEAQGRSAPTVPLAQTQPGPVIVAPHQREARDRRRRHRARSPTRALMPGLERDGRRASADGVGHASTTATGRAHVVADERSREQLLRLGRRAEARAISRRRRRGRCSRRSPSATRRVDALQEADVLVGDEHVDEAAQLARRRRRAARRSRGARPRAPSSTSRDGRRRRRVTSDAPPESSRNCVGMRTVTAIDSVLLDRRERLVERVEGRARSSPSGRTVGATASSVFSPWPVM